MESLEKSLEEIRTAVTPVPEQFVVEDEDN